MLMVLGGFRSFHVLVTTLLTNERLRTRTLGILPAISHSNIKYAKKGRSPNKNEDKNKMEATKQETNNVPERLQK